MSLRRIFTRVNILKILESINWKWYWKDKKIVKSFKLIEIYQILLLIIITTEPVLTLYLLYCIFASLLSKHLLLRKATFNERFLYSCLLHWEYRELNKLIIHLLFAVSHIFYLQAATERWSLKWVFHAIRQNPENVK